MNETPAWIQAITSILTFLAAVAAGWYARRAALYTKQQAEASDDQVKIAKDALEITRVQAESAEEHGNHQAEIARETLEVARKEAQVAQVAADRQLEEAHAAYRRYEESRLDALVPVVLVIVRRPGNFIEMNENWDNVANGWAGNWTPLNLTRYFEEDQRVIFRIRLNVEIQNVSAHAARVDILDPGNGEVSVRQGEPISIPPHGQTVFTWSRHLTPDLLRTDDEINDPKNAFFDLTLWVRDLGINVRDTYKCNSDLRLFARDGSRLVVFHEPEHTWTENVAQPLQHRVYERLEINRATAVNQSGEGTLAAEGQKDPA